MLLIGKREVDLVNRVSVHLARQLLRLSEHFLLPLIMRPSLLSIVNFDIAWNILALDTAKVQRVSFTWSTAHFRYYQINEFNNQ